MRNRLKLSDHVIRPSRLLLTLVSSALLSGCSDYERPLGGKYQIVRTNGSEVQIARDGKGLGRVASYAINNGYFTGFCDTPEDWPNADPGYFLIDTAKDKMTFGMSFEQWKIEVTKINWKQPKLERPK